MLTADEERLVTARLSSQLLAGPPARASIEVVDRLLAVQAQDARGARLAVRSRSKGLVAADVDEALTVTRSLIVTWLNRGTLHLVTTPDYWWLHPLTTPQLATRNERRLRQEGVSPALAERGVAVIAEAVTAHGPQTREQLRLQLDAAGVPTGGQALIHVLFAASLRGLVVRGPIVGNEPAYVSVSQWLGSPPPSLDRDEALGLLARRYLAGHGPAIAQDLAKWAGVTLRDARRGLEVIADELSVFDDRLALAAQHRAAQLPAPKLLGAFDPLLHGWVSRELFVREHRGVVTTNGIFRPVALVEGRVVATWGIVGGTVEIRPLERVPRRALNALIDDARDVLRFLRLPDKPAVIT